MDDYHREAGVVIVLVLTSLEIKPQYSSLFYRFFFLIISSVADIQMTEVQSFYCISVLGNIN